MEHLFFQHNDPQLSQYNGVEAAKNQITVGNLTILSYLGSGKVEAKCNKCGTGKVYTSWYKIKTGHTKTCGCGQKLKDPKQYIGTKLGKLTLTNISPKKLNYAVVGVFDCDCGNKGCHRLLNEWLRGKAVTCGKCNKTVSSLTEDEKEEYKRIIDIWRQLMKRCYQSGKLDATSDPRLLFLNKNIPHARYKDYGARGITVTKEWHDKNEFYRWYIKNVKPGDSIDRINNDLGYNPQNCKSSSAHEQNVNQRLRTDNKTGYAGILYTGFSYQYNLRETVNNVLRRTSKEGFKSALQALVERNITIVKDKYDNKIQCPALAGVEIIQVHNEDRPTYRILINADDEICASKTTFTTDTLDIAKKVVERMRKVALGNEE